MIRRLQEVRLGTAIALLSLKVRMQVKLFQLLDVRVFFTEFEVCSFKYQVVGWLGDGCWSVLEVGLGKGE
jgi:hypothetical protein